MNHLSHLVLLLFISGCANASYLNGQNLEHKSTIEVSGQTQSELFDKCKEWVDQLFIETDSQLEEENKESGTIKGKYIYSRLVGSKYRLIKQNLELKISDGKVEVKMDNAYYRTIEGAYAYTGGTRKYKPIDKKSIKKRVWSRWEGLSNGLEAWINKAENNE